MPLNRSPPSAPRPASPRPTPSVSRCDLEEIGTEKVTKRSKAKTTTQNNQNLDTFREEIKGLFSTLSKTVEQRFQDIKNQYDELRQSLQFMSDRYDSVLGMIQNLEANGDTDRKQVMLLETKVDTLERKLQCIGLEIRNVPNDINENHKTESKSELCDIVKNMASVVKVDLQDHDIRDVYRITTKKEANKTIIVELNSVLMKETVLHGIKNFNKTKAAGDKLNTRHIKIPGPPKPIFVSETLTFKNKRLFHLAREFSRDYKFDYCWTSKGVVYLRKNDKQPFIRIDNESDLDCLKNKI